MKKAVLVVAALGVVPLPALSDQAPQLSPLAGGEATKDVSRDDLVERLSTSGFKDRLTRAVAIVQRACGRDIQDYAGTPSLARAA